MSDEKENEWREWLAQYARAMLAAKPSIPKRRRGAVACPAAAR